MTEETAIRIAEALEKIGGSIGFLCLIIGIGISVYTMWQIIKITRKD